MRKIIIEKEIFEKFPDFKRGVIIIDNLENKEAEAESKEAKTK